MCAYCKIVNILKTVILPTQKTSNIQTLPPNPNFDNKTQKFRNLSHQKPRVPGTYRGHNRGCGGLRRDRHMLLHLLMVHIILLGIHKSTWIPPLYAGRRRGCAERYVAGCPEPIVIPAALHTRADRGGGGHRIRESAGGSGVLETGGHLVGEELLGRNGCSRAPDNVLMMLRELLLLIQQMV